jgi:hypothetical protein
VSGFFHSSRLESCTQVNAGPPRAKVKQDAVERLRRNLLRDRAVGAVSSDEYATQLKECFDVAVRVSDTTWNMGGATWTDEAHGACTFYVLETGESIGSVDNKAGSHVRT